MFIYQLLPNYLAVHIYVPEREQSVLTEGETLVS